ncbi:YdcF family protein [Streptomyces sp. T028]|uniref:YdcF family protein n=1 Tax=Streptomyces sp. T028 TaxID=3394379 RepID=UPI003A8A2945
MSSKHLSADQIREIASFVDIEALPPQGEPTAYFLFGTNQRKPVEIAAERYHEGLAPLVIATGGINRHTGIVEGQEFRRLLIGRGVPESAIRCEDRAANTWQNVEFSLPYIQEALESGLRVTAVSKWYHRRTLHCLATLAPKIGPFYAVSWEPVYAGQVVNRIDWPHIPDGKRRVIREWEEVARRVAEGSFKEVNLVGGAWRAGHG